MISPGSDKLWRTSRRFSRPRAIITCTRRQANEVAHRLGRHGLSLSQVTEYDHPPSLILDLLVEESVWP